MTAIQRYYLHQAHMHLREAEQYCYSNARRHALILVHWYIQQARKS